MTSCDKNNKNKSEQSAKKTGCAKENLCNADGILSEDEGMFAAAIISEIKNEGHDAEKSASSDIKKQKSGKFKNHEELLKAYNELEKEFTKRSQKLRQLEKASMDEIQVQDFSSADSAGSEISETEEVCFAESTDASAAQSGLLDASTLENENGETAVPVVETYENRTDWRLTVDKFFNEIPAARPFAKEIASELMQNPELAECPDCLNKALTRVLASKFRTPEQLLSDGQFLNEFVLKNDSVRNAVLENYFKELGNGLPPVTLASGGYMTSAPGNKPKSIEEAGFMFLKDNKK